MVVERDGDGVDVDVMVVTRVVGMSLTTATPLAWAEAVPREALLVLAKHASGVDWDVPARAAATRAAMLWRMVAVAWCSFGGLR